MILALLEHDGAARVFARAAMLRVREVEAPDVALNVAHYRPFEGEALAPEDAPVPKDPDVVPVVVHRIRLGAGRALVLQFSSFGRFWGRGRAPRRRQGWRPA